MNRKTLLLSLLAASLTLHAQQPHVFAPKTSTPSYAPNPTATGFFTHDKAKLYYETYGAGQPLLLVHGNGGDIGDFKAQIAFFRTHYKIIAMDSRDQGRSSDTPGPLNYELMTGDLVALLDYLHTGPVYVLGWSDGAIEALELGMKYPTRVKKIAAMAANLEPNGATPEALALVSTMIVSTPPAERETPQGKRELKAAQMMLDQPHIPLNALSAITAPTLVLAGDHDLISDEHTLAIYHHIPNSNLAIFPNATHLVPYDDPTLFNTTVDRFFKTPFVKKDRIQDVLKSLTAMHTPQK